MGSKLYAGASVSLLIENPEEDSILKNTFIKLVKQLYEELATETPVIEEKGINSYTLSHKIGVSLDEEYELLQILTENKRYKYLIKHLRALIPAVQRINNTKGIT